ncbi:unnamed protein product [Dibothriocephalus latus]|uniref:Dynein light chain n=1 Tax=Dibothriocephalus latus TaxID=60516 RepID=A0A3P7P0B4_DIBLA|nr:unnamed protein product [Dibothriocephalus latus]
MSSSTKAIVKSADMAEEQQQSAVDLAAEALAKHGIEKDIAAFIKKEFDKQFGPTWHCIVGKNFGRLVCQLLSLFVADPSLTLHLFVVL